jgi:hypothetical protein
MTPLSVQLTNLTTTRLTAVTRKPSVDHKHAVTLHVQEYIYDLCYIRSSVLPQEHIYDVTLCSHIRLSFKENYFRKRKP